MKNLTLKSIDLSSVTIMGTAINIILSIITAVIITIAISAIGGFNLGMSIAMLIPTFVCSMIICSIAEIFLESYLYNILASRIKEISFEINNGEIKSIAMIPTALITAVITTIISIIIYMIAIFIVPLVASVFIQTLFMAGETQIASTLYQVLMIISSPVTMILAWVLIFIGTFIYTAISILIYNFLTKEVNGIEITLRETEGVTYLDYINPTKTATIIGIISAILGLISGLISGIATGQFLTIISSVISGFIVSFVVVIISAYLYNYLAPKLGQIKFHLEE